MADAGQELDSAVELVLMGLEGLAQKYPEHELLQFKDSWYRLPRDFLERFGGEKLHASLRGTDFARAGVYANFYLAIEKAAKTDPAT